MAAIKQDERIRGVDIGGHTQPASTDNGQFNIRKPSTLIDFVVHIVLSCPEKSFIILVVAEEEYSGNKAVFDFEGNVLRGSLSSRTATRLVREWTDLHVRELEEDWKLARKNMTIKKIEPLR